MSQTLIFHRINDSEPAARGIRAEKFHERFPEYMYFAAQIGICIDCIRRQFCDIKVAHSHGRKEDEAGHTGLIFKGKYMLIGDHTEVISAPCACILYKTFVNNPFNAVFFESFL